MNLVQSVKDLLYKHECVVIPELGAFLTQPIKIRIDDSQDIFYPPEKTISYNGLLTQNDGLLVNYIAQRYSISYESALKQILEKVEEWKKELNNNIKVILPEIGNLCLNSEQKIQFQPSRETNFDINSIGLTPFKKKRLSKIANDKLEIKPSKESILRETKTKSKITTSKKITFKETKIMEDSKKGSFAFTPKKRKPKYFKYTIIGLLFVALISVSLYFGNEYIETKRLESTEQAQKKIKSNVQQASFDLGELASLELNIAVKNKEDVSKINYFTVIAGSFREKSKADKMLAVLREEGFDDSDFAKQSPEGLFRVAYGRFKTKKEALNLYYFLRFSLQKEAWYLVE